MKICPSCGGITEEKNAKKCEVCGTTIVQQKDYTKEELENTSVLKDSLNCVKRKNFIKKIKKIMINTSLVTIILASVFLVLWVIERPNKGHINLTKTTFDIYVNETIEIIPIYSEGLSYKDLGIKIEQGELDSFTTWNKGNTFYFKGKKPDTLVISFIVNDDGLQSKYNNKFTLNIKSTPGHVIVEEKEVSLQINETYKVKLILSNNVLFEYVYYTLEESTINGISISKLDGIFFIEAMRKGTYVFTFFTEDDGQQKNYNNKLTIIVP